MNKAALGPDASTNPFVPRTRENEPNFVLFFYIDLPLFILGALYNGYILYVLLSNYTKLVVDRLERVICLLVGAYFSWSVAATIQYSLWLVYASEWFYRVSAIVTSIQLLFIFGASTLLAFERFALIRGFTFEQSRSYFMGIIVYIGAMCGLIVALFISSPSYDTIWPAFPTERTIWTASMLLSFLGMSVAIPILYTLTYIHSTKILAEGIAQMKEMNLDSVNTVAAIRLQRKLLNKCCIMATSLFICHWPEAVSFILVRTLHFDQYTPGLFAYQTVARCLIVLDILVTPTFIIYFMPEIRRAVFRR